MREAEDGDSEVDSSITQAEVTEVVPSPGKVYARVLEKENSADSRIPSDSGGTMRFSSWSWNSGPALYPPQGARGFMGVCPTSPHVLCGSGEGIRPCPSNVVFCGRSAPRVWGPGPLLRAVRSLCNDDRSRSLVRIAGSKSDLFPVHMLDSGRAALYDVVLLASSSQDLQHVLELERFAAAECEAAGMGIRISTSKSEAMVLDRKRVVCPLRDKIADRIQAAEMSFLRRVAGRSLRDRGEKLGHSGGARSRAAAPSLIERSQLRWLGHLFRMPPGRTLP
ncbi:hypothetical protein L3Q82_013555 [Scortum barcoo]|uniref:Uncharacterized protein n=1 Tax=Scortum barcoo TaxID=214431 RepID=A0ACB8W2H7_9TELE|nr:hypothetical protein L3Q82_013555 [Scortum barcoo]